MNIFQKRNKVPHSIWTHPIHFVACGFGVGAVPWMPGTFGTLVGVVFYLILSRFSWITYSVIAVALFIVGIIICDRTNRDFGTVDHSAAVWDEIVGFLFVMILVPRTWYFVLVGFVLFRFFDILKPWPIKIVEHRLPGGLGVMCDDLLAALYSWVLLKIIENMVVR